jgi:hypothetical protein
LTKRGACGAQAPLDPAELTDHRDLAHTVPMIASVTAPDASLAPRAAVVQLRRSSPARRISAGAPRTRRDLLPDPGPSAERLAQAIVEVLAGARPAGQLTGLATLDVIRLLARGAGHFGARRGARPQRPIVGSVHVSEPCDGVVEACAVINTDSRPRALALRLEGIDGQWRCTAVNLG